ncbi:MAG: hypothetical protein IKM00_08070 [Clostridia bacterium]|nr:hypothetical protein [Clostridia bacterium]
MFDDLNLTKNGKISGNLLDQSYQKAKIQKASHFGRGGRRKPDGEGFWEQVYDLSVSFADSSPGASLVESFAERAINNRLSLLFRDRTSLLYFLLT